jgi:hypothetical protein
MVRGEEAEEGAQQVQLRLLRAAGGAVCCVRRPRRAWTPIPPPVKSTRR